MPRQGSIRKYDLTTLKMMINIEQQKKKVIRDSMDEWQVTVEDLERKFEQVHKEENEWKTRYENQVNLNEDLRRQTSVLRRQIDAERGRLKTLVTTGALKGFDNSEAKQIISRLNRERNNLKSQVRDNEWRLDQQSKLYHKANEKREAILSDKKNCHATALAEQERLSNERVQRSLKGLEKELSKKKRYGSGVTPQNNLPLPIKVRKVLQDNRDNPPFSKAGCSHVPVGGSGKASVETSAKGPNQKVTRSKLPRILTQNQPSE